MARIRSIKPEFPQSESMGRVSREARLLFIMLWTICDDSGKTRASSRMLASLLYPYDDDAPKLIDGWLDELEVEECVVRYKANGGVYLQIRKWLNHQKIDRPSKSRFPDFDEASRVFASDSRTITVGSKDLGSKDLGSKDLGSKDLGEKTTHHKASSASPAGVSASVWTDFLKMRSKQRAPVTPTAIAGIEREAKKAGISLDDALRVCCERSWRGFKAEWLEGKGSPLSAAQQALQMIEEREKRAKA